MANVFKDDGLGALGNQLVGLGLGVLKNSVTDPETPTQRATVSGTDKVKRDATEAWDWKMVGLVALAVVVGGFVLFRAFK